MSDIWTVRPGAGEHAPYFGRYIDLVPDGDLLERLRGQVVSTVQLLAPLREEQANYRYAEGKWSVKEVLGHMIDTERIFSYRVLRIARNDATPLPGFEQDDYVKYGPHARQPWPELVEEFQVVRSATLCLLRGLDGEALSRTGTASDHPASARALAWMTAGHELAHMAVFHERYSAVLV
ncbi:DinB family protein [uncultured Paludibaculum sp.]|uniref:DinB family protein n=1 Tax=uncultured Paludibaculum sp. TaxID=1765020 RepID=UPI002AAC16B3|nr:DinB family protein [uncultured Paludibaculum sp.]